MKTTDNTASIFTEEQLKNMSPQHLMELLTIQKKHSESLEIKVKLYEEKLQHLEFINALLSEKLTLSQRRRFGASSEKYADGYEQGSIFNEAEENADSGAQEPQYEEVHPSSYKRKKQKGKKENDLSNFPVVRIEHKLSEEELLCQECNKILKVMTTETTRYLRFIPARFETVEEVVYVYGSPECGVVKRAGKGPSLLKGSIATPSLVAGIMNAKYVNSIPLNRQEQEFNADILTPIPLICYVGVQQS